MSRHAGWQTLPVFDVPRTVPGRHARTEPSLDEWATRLELAAREIGDRDRYLLAETLSNAEVAVREVVVEMRRSIMRGRT